MMCFICSFINAQAIYSIENDVVNQTGLSKPSTNCNSSGIGCPYDKEPIKYIKVNVHF